MDSMPHGVSDCSRTSSSTERKTAPGACTVEGSLNEDSFEKACLRIISDAIIFFILHCNAVIISSFAVLLILELQFKLQFAVRFWFSGRGPWRLRAGEVSNCAALPTARLARCTIRGSLIFQAFRCEEDCPGPRPRLSRENRAKQRSGRRKWQRRDKVRDEAVSWLLWPFPRRPGPCLMPHRLGFVPYASKWHQFAF